MPKTKLTPWSTTDGRFASRKVNFSHVGIDFFGPLFVKRGRSAVKHYGCLFSCLTIRATHIEVAESLETDSFINALRWFISRRGMPKVIRSDNGTNLCGGERELREAVVSWNQEKIRLFLLQRNIYSKFNPPGASHMSGVWGPGKWWPQKISESRDKNNSPIKTSHKIMSPRTRTLILRQRTLNFKLTKELLDSVSSMSLELCY